MRLGVLAGLLALVAAEAEADAVCAAAADRMTAAFYAAIRIEGVDPKPGERGPADTAANLARDMTDPKQCAFIAAMSDDALVLQARRVVRAQRAKGGG